MMLTPLWFDARPCEWRNKMSTFLEVQQHAARAAAAAADLIGGSRAVGAGELKLDTRSAGQLYVGYDFIACKLEDRISLNHYGKFDRVSKEHIIHLGNYVFYSDESRWVQKALDALRAR